MTVHACIAHGLAPGMVRLVRFASGASYPETLEELTPAQARSLAASLITLADVTEKDGGTAESGPA